MRSGLLASGPRRCSTAPGRGRGPAATVGRRCWRWARAWRCRAAPPRARRPVPIDLSRPLEELLGGVDFDIVHVHDPFAPSAASVALRHSRSLNVGSFHEPTERILSTQVARPLVEIFFGRLDARTASCRTTSDLMERFFPGTYELVKPGADRGVAGWWPRHGTSTRDRGSGWRAARADRVLPSRGARRAAALPSGAAAPAAGLDWEAAVWLSGGDEVRIARRLRDRVHLVGPREASPEELIAGADVACVASGGPRLAPGLVRKALATGTVPVASRLSIYEELTGDGERGLLFPPGDAVTLAGQLERLIAEPRLRGRAGSRRARRDPPTGERSPTSSRTSTCRFARAATIPAATRPCAGDSRGGARFTSTSTCTPTTRRIAPRRSRSCWRQPVIAGWARSRSPTTTRSRARSPRVRSPSRWGGSR